MRLAVVFDFQGDFAEGVVAEGGAADLVIFADEFYAGDLFGGQEGGVDGAVAVREFFREFLIAAALCATAGLSSRDRARKILCCG